MGPLHGLKVVEFGSIGPTPFCSMLLADMGAEVIRLDRIEPADLGIKREPRFATVNRGRRSIAMDLKSPEAIRAARRLIAQADALIEGFRPGVMERLGLGPDICLADNPRLVYGRMTGWGQSGPLAQDVGHDINYLAITGALHAIGRQGQAPSVPLNLVGDLGGGSLYLAFGMVCALLEAGRSGRGQVVDGAMVDGVASLLTNVYGALAAGQWVDQRGSNPTDTGAPWYDALETRDGLYVSIGAVEGRFYKTLLERMGIADEPLPAQFDRARWPELRRRFEEVFRTRTRDEWVAIMDGHDACFAPVLGLGEALEHPHLVARQTHVTIDGIPQPAPAPRFSRTVPNLPTPPHAPGADTDAALADWGFTEAELAALHRERAIA